MTSPSSAYLQNMEQWLFQVNWTKIELAWQLLIYIVVMYKFRRYKYFSKMYKRVPTVWLHIGFALLDVFRYHIKALKGPVLADIYDLFMAFMSSYGTLDMCWDLRNRYRRISRPSFQSVAILRIVLSTLAYCLQDPNLHRGSVKLNNAFIYARVGGVLWRKVLRTGNFKIGYTVEVFMALILSMAETRLPGWIYIALSAFVGVAVLNQWTARVIVNKGAAQQCNMFVRSLAWLGFTDIDMLEKKSPINDLTGIEGVVTEPWTSKDSQ